MPNLGPFELSQPLDEGALAAVWSGVHTTTRLPVALKVFHEGLEDRVRQRSLRDELRAMARLEHPHIIGVLDHGTVPPDIDGLPAGVPWMALEFAPHGSLLAQDRPQPWSRIRAWLVELLAALGHAHAHGVLHRDVKPSNVLIDARGRAKLCDFGLASALEPDEASQQGGTPRYMAPEQFLDDAPSQGPWTDLYSVGCLAWRLVTGMPPHTDPGYAALKAAHLYGDLPSLNPWTPVPEGLEAWLQALLRRDPRARFTTAPDAAWHLLDLGPPTILPEEADDLGDFLVTSEEDEVAPAYTITESPLGEDLPVPASPPAPPFPPMAIARRNPPPRRSATSLPLWHMRPIALAGQEVHKRRLWDELSEVHRLRETRIVRLRGQPGIGKGELATWLVEQARESGAGGALRAFHSPVPGPHEGLLGMLRRHFRWVPGQRNAVERALRRRGEADANRIEALWTWLDSGRSPVQVRHHLVVEHFTRLVVRRPYVLLIEDAQWAADAVNVCHSLHRAGLPLLIVLTVDDEALAERPIERHLLHTLPASDIEVAPLSGDQASLLARALPIGDPHLAEATVSASGGRPLFLHELIAEWVASGALRAGRDGPVLDPAALESVPPTMEALWQRRVAQVLRDRDPEDVLALGVAAAIGMVVPWDEWACACRHAGVNARPELVETLIDAGLVRRASGREPTWSFARASLQEAVAASLLEERELVHRACAAMLDELGGSPERRARHLLAAGEGAAAVPELLEGARNALSRGDYAPAAELLDLAEPHNRTPERRIEHQAITTALAHRRGQREDAGEMAIDLLEQAERLGETRYRIEARILLQLTTLADGDLGTSLQWALEAYAIAKESGTDAEIARTALGYGDVLMRLGRDEEAAAPLELAGELADTSRTAILAALSLAEIAKLSGDFDTALARVARAREIAESEESASARGTCDLTEAEVRRYLRDLAGAEEAYGRATLRMEALGEVGGHVARIGWGIAQILQGKLEGVAHVDQGLAHARQHGFPASEAYGLCARAIWAAQQPEAEVFKTELLDGLERIDELGYFEPDFPEVLEAGARRMLELERPSRAQRLRDAAASMWVKLGREDRASQVQDLLAPPPRRR